MAILQLKWHQDSFRTVELSFTRAGLQSEEVSSSHCMMFFDDSVAVPSVGPGLLGLVTELTAQVSRTKAKPVQEIYRNIHILEFGLDLLALPVIMPLSMQGKKALNVLLILLTFCPIYLNIWKTAT